MSQQLASFRHIASKVVCVGRNYAAHVAEMKRLAQAGRGLGSYISRHVGKNFAARLV